jgi:hypothetical protein
MWAHVDKITLNSERSRKLHLLMDWIIFFINDEFKKKYSNSTQLSVGPFFKKGSIRHTVKHGILPLCVPNNYMASTKENMFVTWINKWKSILVALNHQAVVHFTPQQQNLSLGVIASVCTECCGWKLELYRVIRYSQTKKIFKAHFKEGYGLWKFSK